SSVLEVIERLSGQLRTAFPAPLPVSTTPARSRDQCSSTSSECSLTILHGCSTRQQVLETLFEWHPNSARTMRSELNAMPTLLLEQMLILTRFPKQMERYDSLPRACRKFLRDELEPYHTRRVGA